MTNATFQRAMILQQQGRYADAEKELRQALAADPNDAMAHAMLGLCVAARKDYAEATREAQQAVALAPDLPFAHYVMGLILSDRNRYEEAEGAILEAIRLDPYDADSFGVLAQIRLNQRRWPSALEAAEEGLKLDPEHADCTNLRAMALVKLGRRDEAAGTIHGALARDPDNAVTHANQGWALLHEGKPKPAMEHFREALRIDPNLDWARAGIVEALKARNFIYRWMLAYFLWMSRLSGQAQWGVIIGLYIGYRIVRGVARDNPDWAPFLWPLLVLYIAFAVLTWLADPLFNLMLRLSRFGRHALSREQVVASNLVGLSILAAVACLVGMFVTGRTELALLALVFGLLVFPVSGVFKVPEGWPRTAMVLYTVLLLLIGLGAAATTTFDLPSTGPGDPDRNPTGGLSFPLFIVFLIGIFAAAWVVNALAMTQPKR